MIVSQGWWRKLELDEAGPVCCAALRRNMLCVRIDREVVKLTRV